MSNKRLFLIIISYLIFFTIFGIALFLASWMGSKYRKMSYYNKEIFPLYGSERYDEFFKKSANIYNLDIQKDNIFEYINTPYLDGLNYHIVIKKIRNKKNNDEGIIIYFKKLTFITKDMQVINLMYPQRDKPSKSAYRYLGFLGIEFSVKDKNFQEINKQALKASIDPYTPFYFLNQWLGDNNCITGLKLVLNKTTINQIFYPETNYLILHNNKSQFKDEPSLKKEVIPFDTLPLLNNNIEEFNTPNYKGHNKVLIGLVLGVIILFITTFYLVFLNKLVIKIIKEKRALKCELLNKKIISNLAPEQEIKQDK